MLCPSTKLQLGLLTASRLLVLETHLVQKLQCALLVIGRIRASIKQVLRMQGTIQVELMRLEM